MPFHSSRSTNDRLLDAALELLGERGYEGATTRRIAERAGVAEVTLFHRFGSKARLLAAAVGCAGSAFGEAATWRPTCALSSTSPTPPSPSRPRWGCRRRLAG